ncbi:zinc finger protein 723-like [Periplaneta americana]|uniref:zinc finger protein 723-like n=1 Tax=Periplaneta americana TaxID=6978 RepID=UPI0037E6FA6B
MDIIKTEPDVDPLAIQTSDGIDTEEKKPLCQERNFLDLGMNAERVNHSCDLPSGIKVEETAMPTNFVAVKCKAEDESSYLDTVKEEHMLEVMSSEESNASTHDSSNSLEWDAIADEEDVIPQQIGNNYVSLEKPTSKSSVQCFNNDERFRMEARVQTSSHRNDCSVGSEAGGSSNEPRNSDRVLAPSYQLWPHTGDNSFECGYCGMCFTRSGSLNTHARAHRGEKLFKCKDCGKCFAQSSHLNMHIRLHTGGIPFKCDACGKCFQYLSNLKTHLRMHTGEKPFKCNVCEKSFPYQASLKSHARIHTGERPFKCDICGKCFTQSGPLKKHVQLHGSVKPS